MKKKVILILCIGMFALTGCGKVPKLKNGEELFFKVSKTNVSAMDFYTELKDRYGKDVIIEMIDKIILEKKYKEDDEMKSYVDGQIDSIKSQYGGDEQFKQALEQYATTEKQLREQITLDYRRNKAVDDYVKKTITDDEIHEYYKTDIRGDIKASHILIKSTATDEMTDEEKEKADKEAQNKAKDIIKKLDAGAKFADLAKEFGTDGTKDNGGDLGWFGKGTMDEAFEDAVVKLEKGKYSSTPVKTQFGYHVILKVDQKKKPSEKSVKDKIIDTLIDNKLAANAGLKYTALEKTREDAGLKIYDDSINSQYKDYMQTLKTSSNTTN